MAQLTEGMINELRELGLAAEVLGEKQWVISTADMLDRRYHNLLASGDVLLNRIDPHWVKSGRSPGAMWFDLKGQLGADKLYTEGTFQGIRSICTTLIKLSGLVTSMANYGLSLEPAPTPDMIGIPRCHFHRRPVQLRPNLVFVVMPFTPQDVYGHVYECIRSVVCECHPKATLHCLRADDVAGHDVMQDVYESIAASGLVVADTTGMNPNVFLEVGIAITLGKPLVLLTQDDLDSIPFDMRRFRHFRYKCGASGMPKLASYLSKAIGEVHRIDTCVDAEHWFEVLGSSGLLEKLVEPQVRITRKPGSSRRVGDSVNRAS